MHCFNEGKDCGILLLACNSKNLAAFNVESNKLVGQHITLNEDLVKFTRIANILNGLVVVTSPEERNISEGSHFSQHVES
jgi:hypothetical protein